MIIFVSQIINGPKKGENIVDRIITSLPGQVKVDHIMFADDNGILTDGNSVVFHVNALVKTSAKLNRHVYGCQ